MQFKAKTEEELKAELVMPEGEYDFEVIEAADTVSKKGNDMITVKLKVFAPDGGFRLVTDYLMEKMAFKLRHFCETTGMIDRYDAGDLMARHCEGRTGRVLIQVEPEQRGKDRDGNDKTFPPKNSVGDYAKPAAGSGEASGKYRKANVAGVAASDMAEDEVPFHSPHYLTVGGW
jgi:hypothetical protein